MRIKICCIKSVDEARLAIRSGATAVGLVSEMPSGPGVIPEERIAEIVSAVAGEVETFLLTSQRETDAIVAQQRRTGASCLQLVDTLPSGGLEVLRSALPDTGLIQVVHVLNEASIDLAVGVSPHCDALLLDSGSPSGPVRELGGTGRVHDWSLSRRIVERARAPVYLAGGLGPANVAEAIRTVRPTGVDLCSGVRTDGRLDPQKLAAFFHAVYAASAEIQR